MTFTVLTRLNESLEKRFPEKIRLIRNFYFEKIEDKTHEGEQK